MTSPNWKVIEFPALNTLRSTEENIPLPRDQWPTWVNDNQGFTGGWLTLMNEELALSTGHLSTDDLRAQLEVERHANHPWTSGRGLVA